MSRLKSRKTKVIEEWKTIPDYPNYEVSSLGRVRRIAKSSKGGNTHLGKILGVKEPQGYLSVRLYKGDDYRNYLHIKIHRLVLLTFVGPCPEGFVCNHKDFVRDNNELSNLEWIPEVKNNSICSRNGISKKPNRSENDVLEMRELISSKQMSTKEAAHKYNLHISTVRKIINRRIWKHI